MRPTSRLALPLILLMTAPTRAPAATPALDFDAWWDYADPAATAERFQERLDDASAMSGRPPGYRAQLLTQLARTHSLRSQFDQARARLAEVERDPHAELAVVEVRRLLELGRTENSAGAKQAARPLFERALALAQPAGEDGYAVDAAHMLALVEPSTEGQTRWNREAMRLAEASEEPRARKWLGSLYNNQGWTEHDAGHFDAALELFEKALAFRVEQGELSSIRIARWSVARVLRSLGRLDDALAIQRRLAADFAAEGGEDGYVFEELGELHAARGELAKARPYFRDAHRLLAEGHGLEPQRLERLRLLGGAR